MTAATTSGSESMHATFDGATWSGETPFDAIGTIDLAAGPRGIKDLRERRGKNLRAEEEAGQPYAVVAVDVVDRLETGVGDSEVGPVAALSVVQLAFTLVLVAFLAKFGRKKGT